jgi:hypothetical protein
MDQNQARIGRDSDATAVSPIRSMWFLVRSGDCGEGFAKAVAWIGFRLLCPSKGRWVTQSGNGAGFIDPRPLGRQRRLMLWPCYATLMAPNTPGEPRGQTRSAGQLPFTELHGLWRSVLLGRSLVAYPPCCSGFVACASRLQILKRNKSPFARDTLNVSRRVSKHSS